MNKKNFESHEELKETYDKGKFNIFYEDKKKKIKYEVSHLGSTVFCKNVEKGYGMGAVQNFDIKGFYGIEKPKPVIEETLIEGGI